MIKKAAEIAFLVLIFSLAFMQPDIESFGPAMTLTDPIFLVTAAVFAVALVSRQAALRFDRIYVLFGIYGVGLLLSALFSENERASLFKLLGELYLIALAVLTFNIVRTPAMLKRVVLVWLAASGVSALIGTFTVVLFYFGTSNFITDFALHHYGSLPPGNYPRLQGTFLYPSMLCNYLTVSLMLLLAARWMGWIGRTLFVLLVVFFSITIAFTLTPGLGGVMLAVGVWLALIFKKQGRRAPSRLVLSAGVLAAFAFLAVSTFTVIPTPTSPFYFSMGGLRIDPTQRLLTWSGALQTFLAHPLFGKGLGLAVAEVHFMPPSGQLQLLTDAHNILLSVAAQAGVLAAVLLILICIAVVKRALPLDLSGENVLRAAFGIAFLSAFLAQGLVGSFEDARHLWVLIGLIVACGQIVERRRAAMPISP